MQRAHQGGQGLARLVLAGLLILTLALTPQAGQAAIEKKNADATPAQASNPKPDANRDIVLPMPCGLSMILRPVAVPGGLAYDRRFVMGIGNTGEGRQLYERRFEGHIAAPFTAKDLPPDWLPLLEAGTLHGYTFYFLGKYEVSRYQWEAVMSGTCPDQPMPGGDLPKGGVSWFEVQSFLQKYNAWLVQNHAPRLPHFADNPVNIGFLRLPTEEEREFAARGGSKVREEDRDNNDIFPLGENRLEDFGVFTTDTPVHEPLAIGSRKPNPLGLYDTVGNLKEMVDGFFRLSVSDMRENGEVYQRLHGASGGVLCKGGSYHSRADAVLPGWRDEVPLYTAQGESKPNDLGFRVALSGINVASSQRLDALKREDEGRLAEQQAGQEQAEKGKGKTGKTPQTPAAVNTQGDPISELDRLAASAEPEMQANLHKIRAMLADRQSAQERQRVAAQENTARALLYQAETLRGFAFRYFYLHGKMQDYLAKNRDKDTTKARQLFQEQLDEYYQLLLTAANYYKSTLGRVSGVNPSEQVRIMDQFRQEYSADDTLSRHMRENIAKVEKHLKTVRSRGVDALGQKQVCRDIIPSEHLKLLPLGK